MELVDEADRCAAQPGADAVVGAARHRCRRSQPARHRAAPAGRQRAAGWICRAPDGPIRPTISPGCRRKSIPRSTSSTWPPCSKRRTRRSRIRTGSLIAQRLHGIEAGSAPRRIERAPGKTAPATGPQRSPHPTRRHPPAASTGSRSRPEKSCVPVSACSAWRMLSILVAKASPSTKPMKVPTMPIEAPVIMKILRIMPPCGPHGAQDGDVPRLVLHQHHHARDDVEGSDQDDQGQDQEHHVALDVERADQCRIGLLPVGQHHAAIGNDRSDLAADRP